MESVYLRIDVILSIQNNILHNCNVKDMHQITRLALIMNRTVTTLTKIFTMFGIGTTMKNNLHGEPKKEQPVHKLERGEDDSRVTGDFSISRPTL